MSDEKKLDDLAFIRMMIEKGRDRFVYEGTSFILLGSLAASGIGLTYALMPFGSFTIYILWAVIYALGALGMFINLRGNSKNMSIPKGVSFMNTTSIWVSLAGVFLFALSALGLCSIAFVFCAFSLMLGIMYGSFAAVIASKIMNVLAFLWFIVGFFCLYLPSFWAPLTFALGLVALEIVPGIVMTMKNRHSRA